MQFTVKSHTNPNQTYTVTFPDEPQVLPTCTCKGYGYRGMCSHIKEASEQLEQAYRAILIEQAIEDAMIASQPARCTECGDYLVGTHHRLDKCPACYREATFSKERSHAR